MKMIYSYPQYYFKQISIDGKDDVKSKPFIFPMYVIYVEGTKLATIPGNDFDSLEEQLLRYFSSSQCN